MIQIKNLDTGEVREEDEASYLTHKREMAIVKWGDSEDSTATVELNWQQYRSWVNDKHRIKTAAPEEEGTTFEEMVRTPLDEAEAEAEAETEAEAEAETETTTKPKRRK
jgi:glucan-binding YG repeat protein